MLKKSILTALCLIVFCVFSAAATSAQQKKPANAKVKPVAAATPPTTKTPTQKTSTTPKATTTQKTNQRPAAAVSSEPFEKASVETMAAQCVRLDTEAGAIDLEMFPESAPESVRGFLNLAATGALDTTTFSRVVPGFVIQGGDLFTRAGKMTDRLDARARRTLPDEPSQIKHERGILSMARSSEPHSATTNFFILVSQSTPSLDGTFAAFGRVRSGMEVVDAVNKMPVEGEKPTKPVRITRATVAPCAVEPAKPDAKKSPLF